MKKEIRGLLMGAAIVSLAGTLQVGSASADFFDRLGDELGDIGNKAKDLGKRVIKPQPTPPPQQQHNNNQEGDLASDMKGGAAVGAGCAAATHLLGGDTTSVVVAGLACGAAKVGYEQLARSGKKEYAEDYKEITDEMEDTQSEIDDLESSIAKNEKESASHKKEISKLIKEEEESTKFLAKADDIRSDLDDQIRSNSTDRAKAEAKIEILDKQIADLDKIIEDSPDIEALAETRDALKKQKSELVAAVKQSNGVNEELVAQKARLDNEIIERS